MGRFSARGFFVCSNVWCQPSVRVGVLGPEWKWYDAILITPYVILLTQRLPSFDHWDSGTSHSNRRRGEEPAL